MLVSFSVIQLRFILVVCVLIDTHCQEVTRGFKTRVTLSPKSISAVMNIKARGLLSETCGSTSRPATTILLVAEESDLAATQLVVGFCQIDSFLIDFATTSRLLPRRPGCIQACLHLLEGLFEPGADLDTAGV